MSRGVDGGRGGTVWCDPLKNSTPMYTRDSTLETVCASVMKIKGTRTYESCTTIATPNPRDVSLVKTPRTKEEADGLCNYLLLLYCYIFNCRHSPDVKTASFAAFSFSDRPSAKYASKSSSNSFSLFSFSAVGSSSRFLRVRTRPLPFLR